MIFYFLFLRVYVRLFISLSFSFFVSECVYHSPAMLRLIVSAYTSLLRLSYSRSLWISILVFGGYTVTHWTCVCTCLDPCFSLSSLWMPLSGFGKIVTDCPCIVSCLNPHFCLCLSVSVSAYITTNFACTLPVFLSHFLSLNVYTSVRKYHSVLVYK